MDQPRDRTCGRPQRCRPRSPRGRARSCRRAVRRGRRRRASAVRLRRLATPAGRRGRPVRADPGRAQPVLWLGDLDGARAACEQTLDPLAAPTPAAGRTDGRARLGCVRRGSTGRGRAPRGTSAHRCQVRRTRCAHGDGGCRSHPGARGVRARRSRHSRARTRAVALDQRRRAALLRAREPAVALARSGSPMAEPARRSLASSERERSSRPTPPARSSISAMRWKVASRSRSATWTAPPDARSGSRRESGHPCFRLGSSSPETKQTAPTTPSLDARRQRSANASTSRVLSARVAHARKSDALDLLLAEAIAVAKIEGFVVAVADELMPLGPTCHPRFCDPAASGATNRPCSTASNASRHSRTRTQARRDRSAVANSRSLDISRPDSRTRKSRRSSSSRPTRSRPTSSGSTRSSEFRHAPEAVTEVRRLGLF